MISPFARLDRMLAQRDIEPLSLHPHQCLATSFTSLGEAIAQTTYPPPLVILFGDTLRDILEAILRNFPKNIFWDFDFFVTSVLKQASVAEPGADCFLLEFNRKIVSLMELFGNQSSIRFRYLHDFMYGFDWAKWVQKEPQHRHQIAPFSLRFLDYLLHRGQEILQLIDERDRKYHRLDDNSYRNPFGFSREPSDEAYLLIHLAQRNLIPIAAWHYDALPVWSKPFHQTREAVSKELFLSKEQ